MKNTTVLGVHSDAKLNKLDEEARKLYDPTDELLYLIVSKHFNLITKATIRQRLQKIFKGVQIKMKSATDFQIKVVHTYIQWTQKHRKS